MSRLRVLEGSPATSEDHDIRLVTASSDLDLLRLFWPAVSDMDVYRNQHHTFLLRYISSVVADSESRFGLPSEKTKLAIQSVVAARQEPRDAIEAIVQAHYSSYAAEDVTGHALQMIARLWTMLDIQTDLPRYTYQPVAPLVWRPDEPITVVMQRFFAEKSRTEQVGEFPTTVDPDLTAARLVSDHDIRIVWTCNLAEHLSMNWTHKRRILKVFEHKIWVHRHRAHPEISPIPVDVLDELMATYNLLFPMFSRQTESLLEKHGMVNSFYSLGTCGKVPSRNWDDYKYWRKSLHQLSQVLDEPPRGVQQFWKTSKKDPNLLNVILFWISGVMVAILTIVSSICGVMSVQYAIQSRDIGLQQLELAIAQACADMELIKKLPQYCEQRS